MAFFTISLFAGCDDKGKESPDKDSCIVGKWQFVREVGTESLNGQVTNTWDDDLTADRTFVTFSSNGTGFSTEAGNESDPFTYTVSGDVLTMKMNGENATMAIRKLTSTQMVLHNSYEDEEGYKNDVTAYLVRK